MAKIFVNGSVDHVTYNPVEYRYGKVEVFKKQINDRVAANWPLNVTGP